MELELLMAMALELELALEQLTHTKHCGRRAGAGPGQCQMSCGSVSLVP